MACPIPVGVSNCPAITTYSVGGVDYIGFIRCDATGAQVLAVFELCSGVPSGAPTYYDMNGALVTPPLPIQDCGSGDFEQNILCDTAVDPPKPFISRVVFDADGDLIPEQSGTFELDTVTPYTPVGPVTVCGGDIVDTELVGPFCEKDSTGATVGSVWWKIKYRGQVQIAASLVGVKNAAPQSWLDVYPIGAGNVVADCGMASTASIVENCGDAGRTVIVYGNNLLTNGDFNSSVAGVAGPGWITDYGTNSFGPVGNMGISTGPDGSPAWAVDISPNINARIFHWDNIYLENGKTYQVRMDLNWTGVGAQMDVAARVDGVIVLGLLGNVAGVWNTASDTFVFTGATGFHTFSVTSNSNANVGNDGTFDNISLRHAFSAQTEVRNPHTYSDTVRAIVDQIVETTGCNDDRRDELLAQIASLLTNSEDTEFNGPLCEKNAAGVIVGYVWHKLIQNGDVQTTSLSGYKVAAPGTWLDSYTLGAGNVLVNCQISGSASIIDDCTDVARSLIAYGPNLLVNGDFEQSTGVGAASVAGPGWTTTYGATSTIFVGALGNGLWAFFDTNAGAITGNANPTAPLINALTGRSMAVNVGPNIATPIISWSNIYLENGATYELSCDVAIINNPFGVGIQIDGVVITPVVAPAAAGVWQTTKTNFTYAGVTGYHTVSLNANTNVAAGNDHCFDNFELRRAFAANVESLTSRNYDSTVRAIVDQVVEITGCNDDRRDALLAEITTLLSQNQSEFEVLVLCDDNGSFIRRILRNSDDTYVVTNLALDGVTAYTPVGVVKTCEPGEPSEFEVLVLCDDNGTFIRRFIRNADGTYTVTNLALDGVTAYVPAGVIKVCGATQKIEVLCLCDDTDADGVGDVAIKEIVSIDDAGVVTHLSYYTEDLSAPYVPVSLVGCTPPGENYTQIVPRYRVLQGAGNWTLGADSSLPTQSVTFTVIAVGSVANPPTVTDALGTNPLFQGQAISWSILLERDFGGLKAPLILTTQVGDIVSINFTEEV